MRDFLVDKTANSEIDKDTFLHLMSDETVVNATRAGFDWCEERAISALPTLFLDTGGGPQLVCGGYATADYLIPDITARLTTH